MSPQQKRALFPEISNDDHMESKAERADVSYRSPRCARSGKSAEVSPETLLRRHNFFLYENDVSLHVH